MSGLSCPNPYLDDAKLPITLILHAKFEGSGEPRYAGLHYELPDPGPDYNGEILEFPEPKMIAAWCDD